MFHRRIDMSGRKIGRLTVLEYAGRGNSGEATWLCQCDCGNKVVVRGGHLRSGQVSCSKCSNTEKNKQNAKHNMSRTRLYSTYYSMLKRCYLKSNASYPRYGGRGIGVCDEWRDKEHGFLSFKEWSVRFGYREGLTLDRIDNDKGYSPENCRWVDAKTQANNRHNNKHLTYNGETHTVSEWASITSIKRETLDNRLRLGWNVEDALTKPIRGGDTMPKRKKYPKLPSGY